MRWEFEARLRRRYSNRVDRKTGEYNVEAAWEEIIEGILRSAVEICGMSRISRGGRRTAWWSKEVQDPVRAKKIAYKRLLSQLTKEAKLAYNEAKKEAKSRVRKAKNEEWIRLGKEVEKEARGIQRRLWSRVKAKERVTTTQRARWGVEIRKGGTEQMVVTF